MVANRTMGMPRGRAPQRGEGPVAVAGYVQGRKGKAEPERPGEEIVKRRHPDWVDHQIGWRWLLDSYEGGQRYRDATYGPDRRGLPSRNLVRHKREYPDPFEFANTLQGSGAFTGGAPQMAQQASMGPYPGMLGADPSVTAHDDVFEYRRARTPVPEWVAEVVDIHLGKVYDQSISRTGPPALEEWWKNVNGGGMPIDDWMREEIAPLLMVLGTIDICIDHPAPPHGVPIVTQADEQQYGLDRVVASYILPENMVWWANDHAGNFVECLVREFACPRLGDPDYEDEDMLAADTVTVGAPDNRVGSRERFRHWTMTTVALYTSDGQVVEPPRDHGYAGFIPIRRLIDKKRHRTPMVGKSRNEAIAELQHEFYNRDSELILSDTLQSSPLLSGPPEVCKSDQTVSIGPDYVLPKYLNGNTYVGWEYVSPPKDPAASLRTNKLDLVEMKDRHACLTKPAGVTGTTGGTVSQSGYSKAMDENSGSKVLGGIAKALARCERQIAELALMVMNRRQLQQPERDAILIDYPSRFQLQSSEAILNELLLLVQITAIEEQAPVPGATQTGGDPAQDGGNPALRTIGGTPVRLGGHYWVPTLLAERIMQYTYATLTGDDRSVFDRIKAECEVFLKLNSIPDVGTISHDDSVSNGRGSREQDAGSDPMGQTGSTMVGGETTLVN